MDMYAIGMVISMIVFFICYFAALALMITSQVCLAISVYRDAQALGRTDGMLFALLTGFLGQIPLVIYMAIRSNMPSYNCPRCSMPLNQAVQTCPNCAQPITTLPAAYIPGAADASVARMRGKKMQKTAIVTYVIGTVLVLVGVAVFFIGMFGSMPELIASSY